jgi:hypothetical protein
VRVGELREGRGEGMSVCVECDGTGCDVDVGGRCEICGGTGQVCGVCCEAEGECICEDEWDSAS